MDTAPLAPPTFELLALDHITPSPTNPRKHFDADALNELAESIKAQGELQPILARTTGAGIELIAGERRWRAARIAGLPAIPAIVRALDDRQVLEIQIIENMQRADLSPLEEADGYNQLIKTHGYTPADIAHKIGKSVEYVWARIKLASLCEHVRQRLARGELAPSVALLIARIPVADLQKQAADEIADHWKPMSTREAADLLQRNYMLRLKDAPFDIKDAQLVPAAGACGPCPKRTGNQAELFNDIKGGDTCTDTQCFAAKRAAARALRIAQLKEAGTPVITGKAAKAIKPSFYAQLTGGYVELDEQCWADAKRRTYRKLLGKDQPAVTVLDDPHTGKLIDIVKTADIAGTLKARGVTPPGKRAASSNPEAHAALVKQKNENEIRRKVFEAVRAAYPSTLDAMLLRVVAQRMMYNAGADIERIVCDIRGWNFKALRRNYTKQIAAMESDDLPGLALDIALAPYTRTHYGGGSDMELLGEAAALMRIDADAIRKATQAEQRARQAAKAKPAKAKAGGAGRPRKATPEANT